WFLLPAEDSPSAAADWFSLDDNEERVRVGGLVVAAVLALLAVVGDTGWGWGSGFPWWILPAGLLFLVFVALPRRRRTDAAPQPAASISSDVEVAAPSLPRERRSQGLLGLTASISAIALAVTRLVADTRGGTEWTTYVAVALGVVGLGL